MEQIYHTIDIIIASQKKARQDANYLKLVVNAEALLELIPTLINYCVEQESEYRKFESGLIDEKDANEKKLTSAYCETKAKATSFYKEWQRVKMFIELMYEMVQISKKLAGSVDRELSASKN